MRTPTDEKGKEPVTRHTLLSASESALTRQCKLSFVVTGWQHPLFFDGVELEGSSVPSS